MGGSVPIPSTKKDSAAFSRAFIGPGSRGRRLSPSPAAGGAAPSPAAGGDAATDGIDEARDLRMSAMEEGDMLTRRDLVCGEMGGHAD